MPQRRYEPTEADRTKLLALLGAAVPLPKISLVLGISEDTIRRHYPRELAGSGLTRGRKPFDPSPEQREMVRGLATVGVSHDDIAAALRISPTTLRRHCHQELRVGTLRAKMKVGASLLRIALANPPVSGTVEAAIWWSKARMGWQDPSPGHTSRMARYIRGRDDRGAREGGSGRRSSLGDTIADGGWPAPAWPGHGAPFEADSDA